MGVLFSEAGIKNAVSLKRFRICLQPQIALKNGRVEGAEAVARLYSDDGKIVFQENYIRGMEVKQSVYLLDLYTLREVCGILREWRESGRGLIFVSVKFSRYTMEMQGITDRLALIQEEYRDVISWITIEVTESYQGQDWAGFIQNCWNFCRMGFSLSIDRYGSAWADNRLLGEPWFDEVRIDRKLVERIDSRDMDYLQVKVLADFCKKQNRRLVAEGVENREQYMTLKRLGCDRVQGAYTGAFAERSRFEEMYPGRTVSETEEHDYCSLAK